MGVGSRHCANEGELDEVDAWAPARLQRERSRRQSLSWRCTVGRCRRQSPASNKIQIALCAWCAIKATKFRRCKRRSAIRSHSAVPTWSWRSSDRTESVLCWRSLGLVLARQWGNIERNDSTVTARGLLICRRCSGHCGSLGFGFLGWSTESITLQGRWDLYTARCQGGLWQGEQCTESSDPR